MEFCDEFCCFGEVGCRNKGKHFVNLSRYHMICDKHFSIDEHEFRCWYCKSKVKVFRRVLEPQSKLCSESGLKHERNKFTSYESHNDSSEILISHDEYAQSLNSRKSLNRTIPILISTENEGNNSVDYLTPGIMSPREKFESIKSSIYQNDSYKHSKKNLTYHDKIYQEDNFFVYFIYIKFPTQQILIKNHLSEESFKIKYKAFSNEISFYKKFSQMITENNCFLEVFNDESLHNKNEREIFLEYYENSLFDCIYFNINQGKHVPEAQLKSLIYKLINSFYQLEKEGIYHRDISLDNIQVKDWNSFKIFNFSKATKNVEQDPLIPIKDIKDLGKVLLCLYKMDISPPEISDIDKIVYPWLRNLLTFMMLSENKELTFKSCLETLMDLTGLQYLQ